MQNAACRRISSGTSKKATPNAFERVAARCSQPRRKEAKALEPLYALTRLLSVDDKRVHVFQALHRQRDDVLVATGEQMYLHVDTKAGKASVIDPAVREKLEKIRATQSGLAVPAQVGRHVGMPRE